MTITEFLLARIAEDEAVAGAASAGPWYPDYVPELGGGQYGDWVVDSEETFICSTQIHNERGERDSEHITRHDPPRVLAECAAKRAIIDAHPIFDDLPPLYCDVCVTGHNAERWPCPTIRALATVYADHPDYDPEWRL